MRISICILLIFSFVRAFPQQLQILTSGNKTSIRGLSVVDDNIVWVSGSNGTVGKSVDGGKNWQWMVVKDFEKRDFRDIEAFDANTAIIMAITEPANILKTTDGGKNWTVVFTDSTKGMFLDAMDFSDERHGVVIGDPVSNTIFIARTENGGDNWTIDTNAPHAFDGEGFFASSGTNIRMATDKKPGINPVYFVSGGKRSRLFMNDSAYELNIIQGEESQGANSIALDPVARKAVIVGGDFSKDTLAKNNCILLSFSKPGFHPIFSISQTPPHGYRSCVEYISTNQLITCGTSGVDVSADGGSNWKPISGESFHVCRKAKKGKAVFLAGGNGKIALLNW